VGKRSLRIVAFAAAVIFVSGPASGAARITGSELLERIDRARAIALSSEAPAPARMFELRAALGFPVVVAFPGGEVTIPKDRLIEGLRGSRARDFSLVAARLDALARVARSAAATAQIDRDRVEAALDAAYVGVRSEPGWFERAARFIGRLFSEFFARLASFAGAGSVIAWIVVAGLIVGALFLLRRLSLVPERRRAARTEAGGPAVDWALVAEEALARGDVAAAIRARFRLLVGALSDRGVVVDEPSLTAGECRQAVRSAMPGAYQSVARATEVFELAAYAHAALTRTDLETLREAERVVRAA
jgi:hypothetical protein